MSNPKMLDDSIIAYSTFGNHNVLDGLRKQWNYSQQPSCFNTIYKINLYSKTSC